tara:strand:- start:35 stop:1027 length:993 start_codon:yes stop_codon:yes gene_type:complete
MGYTAGDTILDNEYNDFANDASNNINAIWGASTGNKGYGQTNTISAVSAGNAITAAQWNTLQDRLKSIADHQGTTINNAAGSLSGGDTVEILANFGADITTVTNARYTVAGANVTASSNPNSINRSYTGDWTTNTIHECKFTFASSDAARYFFNAGGSITHVWNLSGSTTSDKSSEWVDLFNTKAATFTLAGATDGLSGSGSQNTNANDGFWNTNLTNGGSYVVIQKMFADSSPYTSNYVQWEVKISGTSGSLGGKGEVVTIKATAKDDAADSSDEGQGPQDAADAAQTALDVVDGTLTSSWTFNKPNTNQLNNDAIGTITAAEVSQTQA